MGSGVSEACAPWSARGGRSTGCLSLGAPLAGKPRAVERLLGWRPGRKEPLIHHPTMFTEHSAAKHPAGWARGPSSAGARALPQGGHPELGG